MSVRLSSILSLAVLAVFVCTLSAAPGHALSLQSSDHLVRSNHGDISRRKRAALSPRSNSKRCAARSSTIASSTIATTSTTTSTKKAVAAATTKKAAAAATTAKAATSTKAASSSGGVNFSGTSCLAWPNGGANDLSAWKGSNTGLIYSWDANKPPKADALGFTYAPMIWGWKNAEDFKAKAVEGYAKIALGPNECNEVGQSNMDPYSAITLWREYMLPLQYKGYTLISPAMSSRPNGKQWMQTFMQNCGSDCAVAGIATHYYGTDIEEFKTYVSYWHDTYNLPVYVTEYADQDFNGGPQASMDEIWAFMTAATQWMNSQSWVKAHCWFGAMEGMDNVNPLNKLMNSAGTAPNDLGDYFINN
ncbi:glycosyl hydrolase catalytic core-domain-containing protein [Mycena sp. CBHHK59/15]|nr:glycosyl hydrolase catalytic core-domain-containing protein [Mycena sp. CBHHK59/15]